jgi:lipopolysaccharide transport system permease protein
MLVFTIVFSKLAKMPTEGTTPYTILVFAGLLPWQFFSNALTESSNSLIGNSNLISKVYFPRLIIPASSIITSFIDFLISFVILISLMVYYQFIPSWHIIFMPFFIIIVFLASFGAGLWLTTMNVKFRDFRYIVPFIVQLGLYISPVGFSSNIIPEKWRFFYSLNPMVGIIDGFRWCILGGGSEFNRNGFLLSFTVIILLMWYSIRHFRKMEKAFADYI